MSLFFNTVAVSKHFQLCLQNVLFISEHLLFLLGAALHGHPVTWVLGWHLSSSLHAKRTPAVHAGVAGANLFLF